MTETTIYPITLLGSGSLSIMAKPDSTDLATVFKSIKSAGTTHLVSLLAVDEADTLGLDSESTWCEQYQIDFLHFPIADFSTPSSTTEFAAFTLSLHSLIQQGAHMVIHCRGGIGRAGMTSSAVLVHAGFNAFDAMTCVTEARGTTVPETEDQKRLVQKMEQWVER